MNQHDEGLSDRDEAHWAAIKAAVRRLKGDPDFQDFIKELKLMKRRSQMRSFDPEVQRDHINLVGEVVLQSTLDEILMVAITGDPNGSLDEDDELALALAEDLDDLDGLPEGGSPSF